MSDSQKKYCLYLEYGEVIQLKFRTLVIYWYLAIYKTFDFSGISCVNKMHYMLIFPGVNWYNVFTYYLISSKFKNLKVKRQLKSLGEIIIWYER